MTKTEEKRNVYAGCPLDRAAAQRRDAAWIAARLAEPTTRILPVWRDRNLVAEDDPPRPVFVPAAAAEALLAQASTVAFLGLAADCAHFAVDLSHLEDPAVVLPSRPGAFLDLRAVGAVIGHADGALLAYARGLMHWHGRNRFCGACGSPTESLEAGHLRRCTNADCGGLHHPRTDPAVIMLVTDGDRVLLGRQPRWPAGRYSVLAGFVEPGESLEEAVRREVLEEVGVETEAIHYHSSQPWPFPASIMLGFTARARSTALRVAEDELEDARWFDREELRRCPEDEHFSLPSRASIARRLIEDWLAGSV